MELWMIYGELLGTMIQRGEVICETSHSQQSAGINIQTQVYLTIKSVLYQLMTLLKL